MDIKKYFVDFPLELLDQVKKTSNHFPKIWQKLLNRNYAWTQSGLEQVEKLLLNFAKSHKHVQQQLTQLSHKANAELVPIFKNQTFLRLLADKMKLSPKTINIIKNLLNRFDQKSGPFSATNLLIIVLFIALSTQAPLIFKGTFSTKKAVVSVVSGLDYVLTAIDLAKKFQNSQHK
ncbi:hypothetical protein [Lactobacillus sp. ESL0225]|uniref:hypothetical protein n=1 Tax=Lactobacillus sp. ESL0225 TaxID=2069351 RepID=UPI000EFA9E8F|nr:hypothetical protein [Lactobacillus sp. ESL0225]RMC48160.1 hypothetical protein F5ESL0225_07550 [Lactobacillus sp. ESL0225]